MKKDSFFWPAVIIILVFSLLCAIFVLVWFYKKKHPAPGTWGKHSLRDTLEPDDALKRWRILAICWPLLCVLFTGLILWQSYLGTKHRMMFDLAFTLIPLVFFALGMSLQRRLLRERRYAVQSTTASVVSDGRRDHNGKEQFFPEFSFQLGDTPYHVTSPLGYGRRVLREGRQVTLYYAPENPKLFYVPALQRRDRCLSVLLCILGFLLPLVGLFAPLLRLLLVSHP